MLILVWSYSNAPFAISLPTQRTEAILEGMSQAFVFFGCVPKEVWWDNPKTVATAILKGRERTINERYAALASHFAFGPLYCMPRSGNEKPIVEIRVKTLERNWSTPVPKVQDLDELNAYLRQRCVAEMDRVSSRQTDTIGVRFAAEKACASPLPRHSFDACVRQEAKVDKYQFARFDNVSYSVPRQCAFQTVTVKAYVDRVEIVHQNSFVASHSHSNSRGDQLLDPLRVSGAEGPGHLRFFSVAVGQQTVGAGAFSMEWISARRNACVVGQPGTGKTHLAVALGLAACRQGLRTKFFTAAALELGTRLLNHCPSECDSPSLADTARFTRISLRRPTSARSQMESRGGLGVGLRTSSNRMQ